MHSHCSRFIDIRVRTALLLPAPWSYPHTRSRQSPCPEADLQPTSYGLC